MIKSFKVMLGSFSLASHITEWAGAFCIQFSFMGGPSAFQAASQTHRFFFFSTRISSLHSRFFSSRLHQSHFLSPTASALTSASGFGAIPLKVPSIFYHLYNSFSFVTATTIHNIAKAKTKTSTISPPQVTQKHSVTSSAAEYYMADSHDAVKDTKKRLRAQVNQRLRDLSRDQIIYQSRQMVQKLLNMDIWKNSKSVALFVGVDSEIDTEPLLLDAFKTGKTCFLPVMMDVKAGLMEFLQAYSLDDIRSWVPNKWNIREPPTDQKRCNPLDPFYNPQAYDHHRASSLDIIVVPGLAFDLQRNRLGKGKGFYDRYIKRCVQLYSEKGVPPPTIIALALSEQLVDQVPVNEYDAAIDVLIHLDGILSEEL